MKVNIYLKAYLHSLISPFTESIKNGIRLCLFHFFCGNYIYVIDWYVSYWIETLM